MKYCKIFLSLTILLPLLITAILTTPASAAVGTISIDPDSGPIDTEVSISGSGFTANTDYTIKFGTTVVRTGATDASGNFVTDFAVPGSPGGEYAVVVTTDAADTSDTQYFMVTPEIELSDDEGHVGAQVTVNGIGFKATSSVKLYFDSTHVGTATTDASGILDSAAFTVPASSNGNHKITGKDTASTSPDVTFKTLQRITITSSSGVIGDSVTISGTGFASNSMVTIDFGNEPVSTGATTTNSNGSFSSTFAIPSSDRGRHTIEAKDASDNAATADFTVGQKIAIDPTTGPAGTMVTITGTGFRARKSITVKYNAAVVFTNPESIDTDANGSFNGTFDAPAGLTGSYIVEVEDGKYSASANFIAILEATISPVTSEDVPGHVGMEITINGTGFKPNTKVTITRTSDLMVLAGTDTDSVGGFSATFMIPLSEGGEHVITATDGTNSEQFTFVIETQAPPIPNLLLPAIDTKAQRPVHFDWKDSDDLSSVTYTLQIASSDDFTSIVLEKEGLPRSKYTITEEDKLQSASKQEPYYWRVKAIDGAFNESQWSKTGSFYLGFVLGLPNGDTELTLPAWAVYFLVTIALFQIGLFCFWLGKKKGRYND